METFSTRQAARKLGIDPMTLSRYIAAGKVPSPRMVEVGAVRLHAWTEGEIEKLRQLLPKIANGRKTRHQKSGQKKQPKKQSKP